MNTTINLATYAIRDAAGNVDLDSTMDKFAADLEMYVAERETETETIANAVDTVFDKLNGARANKPFIVNQVLTLLNVAEHPTMFKMLSDRVNSYLTDNSQGKIVNKATGEVERPDSLFVIGRGRGTIGCQRRADLKVTESK